MDTQRIIVQKFGGTSVRDENGRKHALKHIKEALRGGYKVVCVVSAMGRSGEPYATDTLLQLVNGKKGHVSLRELDLLMSCGELISSIVFSNMLNENDVKATALTGGQAGFQTSDDFTNARILTMNVNRIHTLLKSHDVVIVAGFQGKTQDGDTTTLGRGGSDTSAAALGVALQSDYIDIFTDVNGIMTADPRIVKNAQAMKVATYNEICNLAYQGAKVIHPRAVEIAMQGKVPMRVRSTYSQSLGTLITTLERRKDAVVLNEESITGIANVSNITQIKLLAKEGQYDLQAKVFKAMANAKISVDFINMSPRGIIYTVSEEDTEVALKTLEKMELEPVVTQNCAKVAVVGAGISNSVNIRFKIVSALTENGIHILQSADSHTTIWILVSQEEMIRTVNVLHEAFNLHEKVQL